LARHQKELTKQQKITIYIYVTICSVFVAICAVLLILHLVKNPPPVILISSKSSYNSNYSNHHSLSSELSQTNQDKSISGVTDGNTYYTTQCAVVMGENVDTVTLNGEEVNNTFLIPGNAKKTHKIIITYTDKTTTKITIYTSPISEILSPLKGINEFNATADNISAINDIRDKALRVQGRYSPYSETKAVEDIVTACDLMLEKINAATNAFETVQKAVEKFETTEITDKNYDELFELSQTINALSTNKNLTDNQLVSLGIMARKCNVWLTSLSTIK